MPHFIQDIASQLEYNDLCGLPKPKVRDLKNLDVESALNARSIAKK
jgi:hypothetical protein